MQSGLLFRVDASLENFDRVRRALHTRDTLRASLRKISFSTEQSPRPSSFPSLLLPCNDRRKISKSGSRKHKWKVKRATESHHSALVSSSIVHPSTVRAPAFYDAKLRQHTRWLEKVFERFSQPFMNALCVIRNTLKFH